MTQWTVTWFDTDHWETRNYSGQLASDVVDMFEANRPDAFDYPFLIKKATND